MKNFLQNLLIFFALCLCALISFQWVRDTKQVAELQLKQNRIDDLSQANTNLTADLRRARDDIARLSGLRDELSAMLKSNNVQIASLSKQVETNTIEIERDQKQIEVYRDALEKANANIVKQNESIETQNAQLRRLAEERNLFIEGYNHVAARFNELGQDWNSMAAALSKGATNASPAANAAFVTEYNKAAAKFGDLAAEWNKLQTSLQQGATNAPASTNTPAATNSPAQN